MEPVGDSVIQDLSLPGRSCVDQYDRLYVVLYKGSRRMK